MLIMLHGCIHGWRMIYAFTTCDLRFALCLSYKLTNYACVYRRVINEMYELIIISFNSYRYTLIVQKC